MGNIVGISNSSNRRRAHRVGNSGSQHVYAAAYTSTYPNLPPPHAPYYKYQNGARYPPPPLPLPESHDDDHHRMAMDRASEAWVDGGYPPINVDYQTVTISNDINIKKETLKIEADEDDTGKFLVTFIFDATVPCNITLYFFEKEEKTTMKDDSHSIPPLTVSFQEGLGQIFRQKPGTGIDLSTIDESELCNVNETSVYLLAVKVEATQVEGSVDYNSQITYAVFEKDKDRYNVRVVKQVLLVEGERYDMEEIYGFGNSVINGGDDDIGNDIGKECVICLLEPRNTTVLPCRHMCICYGCAKVLRFKTNIQCPICKQPVERLLGIKINSGVAD